MMDSILPLLCLAVAVGGLVIMVRLNRRREGALVREIVEKNKNGLKDFRKELAPRKLLVRFAAIFGQLFLYIGVYGLIEKASEWKLALGTMGIGAVMLAFAISLIKSASTPMAVHLNRAVFFAYGFLFAGVSWVSWKRNVPIVVLIGALLFLAAIAGMICSFSRKLPARWVLAAIQVGFAVFITFVILHSRGPAWWGHPIAGGIWAGLTILLVIGLFGKESNAYYSLQISDTTAQGEKTDV